MTSGPLAGVSRILSHLDKLRRQRPIVPTTRADVVEIEAGAKLLAGACPHAEPAQRRAAWSVRDDRCQAIGPDAPESLQGREENGIVAVVTHASRGHHQNLSGAGGPLRNCPVAGAGAATTNRHWPIWCRRSGW